MTTEKPDAAEHRDKDSASPGPRTGRTVMDVVDRQFSIIHRAAPRLWPILLIIGCALYVWYTLKDADADARREVQAELDSARERVTDTYLKISEMTERQLASISGLMKLEDEVEKKLADAERDRVAAVAARGEAELATTTAETARDEAERLAEKARQDQSLAESARDAAANAVDEANDRAQQFVDRTAQLQSRMESAQQEMDAKETQLHEVNAALATRQAQLQEGTGELDRVRTDLLDLIRATVSDPDLISSAAAERALALKGMYGLDDQGQINLFGTLVAFGLDPSAATARAMRQFIGVEQASLTKALGQLASDSQTRDLYACWYQILDQDNLSRELYVGAVKLTDTECLGVLVFTVDNGKVCAVTRLEKLFAVPVRDPGDWPAPAGLLIGRTFEGRIDQSLYPRQFKRDSETWSIDQIVEQESGIDAENLAGQSTPIRYVTLDAFRENEPELYEAASGLLGYLIDFERRAASFDPNQIEFQERVPSDLAEAKSRFLELLAEFVAGKRMIVGELDVYSVLAPEFIVVDVSRVAEELIKTIEVPERCVFTCITEGQTMTVTMQRLPGGRWEPVPP